MWTTKEVIKSSSIDPYDTEKRTRPYISWFPVSFRVSMRTGISGTIKRLSVSFVAIS